MTHRNGRRLGERDVYRTAESASQRIQDVVSLIERSSPEVLRAIRDNLEIEIMIDRTGRSRRRLLRLISEYCDRRIREKERDPGVMGLGGGLRSLLSARHRTDVLPDRPT